MSFPNNRHGNTPPYLLSAYGIAVKHGYTGTEEEWLASLKGDQGEYPRMQFDSETGYLQIRYDDSGEWTDIASLADLMTESEEAVVASAKEYADTAEAYAKGTVDDEDVEEGDPGYEDNAKYYAGQASTYASAAGGFATGASNYAQAASGYATTASGHAGNAATSATAAAGSATSAAGSATSASNSAGSASTSASAAEAQATQAGTYAYNADQSAQAAASYAAAANTAYSAVVDVANGVDVKVEDIETQVSIAAGYASAAGTSATNAATSATAASGSATAAAGSASNAADSATAAAGSATAAAGSASSVSASAAQITTNKNDIADLKSALNDGWKDLTPSTVKGYIAQPSTVNVIEPTGYSASYTGKMIWNKCNAGDKYKATITGTPGLYPYIITNNSGVVTAHGITGQGVTDFEVDITEDGYFGANQYGENDYVKKLSGIPKDNKNILNTIKTEIEPKFEHKYIGTSANIDVSNPGTYSASYAGGYVLEECKPGERFVLSISNIASSAYDIGIYNAEGELIAHSLVGRTGKELIDWTVIIPENGAYIGINVINNTGKIIYYRNNDGEIYNKIWKAIDSLGFNPFKGKKGVAFGTSLTQRSDGTGTYGYLTKLRELLECDIENKGVGGAYWFLTDYSQRSITYNVEQYQDYADKDFVIIEGCVNDWFTSKVLGTYTDNVYTSVCGCLRKMINHVYSQKPTAQIFVILDHTGKQYTEELDCSADKVVNGKTQYEYYSELKKVCELCGIPAICEYSESSIGIYGTEYLADNIHCNELGAKWSGTFIAQEMRKIGLKVIS